MCVSVIAWGVKGGGRLNKSKNGNVSKLIHARTHPHPQHAPTQLGKFKRLLTLSRQRLEENQRALAEKDGALSRLTKEGEALRARAAQLQQQVAALQQQVQSQQSQQSQASSSGNGNGGGGGRTPGRALLRVDVSGRVWLLLESEGEGVGREREGEGDYWQSFGCVSGIHVCVRNVCSCQGLVPPS